MNKAFIFDMDGVIVHSEPSWEDVEREFLPKMFGTEVASKMPNLVGAGLEGVFESAESLGAVFDRTEATQTYDEIARQVYARSPITKGVNELAQHLVGLDFKLGIVTQSPQTWIDRVVPQLSFKDKLEAIVSLAERPDLKRKPAPDGFLEAFKILDADPRQSFVLEDSNPGIAAAKASGAFTIGFRANLVLGYEQTDANAYADTMEEVWRIVTQQ